MSLKCQWGLCTVPFVLRLGVELVRKNKNKRRKGDESLILKCIFHSVEYLLPIKFACFRLFLLLHCAVKVRKKEEEKKLSCSLINYQVTFNDILWQCNWKIFGYHRKIESCAKKRTKGNTHEQFIITIINVIPKISICKVTASLALLNEQSNSTWQQPLIDKWINRNPIFAKKIYFFSRLITVN